MNYMTSAVLIMVSVVLIMVSLDRNRLKKERDKERYQVAYPVSRVQVIAKNITPYSITTGSIVYFLGTNSAGIQVITLADPKDGILHLQAGIALETITSGETGQIVIKDK
jgi:hypothetical protein